MSFFQKISCQGCGAPVEFKTTSSLFAICPYCSTTVAKSEGEILSHSKKSSVIEDFSKIKIGTTGRFKSLNFSVVGRIQLKYFYGFWNEWFILFDDGSTGWLSDVGDDYIVTLDFNSSNASLINKFWSINPENLKSNSDLLSGFDHIKVDQDYRIGEDKFLCFDISIGNIIGAEGEIGFNLLRNQTFKAVDLKKENIFITADYSDSDLPTLYIGESLNEAELFLSNTKTTEEIQNSTGSYKGKLTNFKCPNCGSGNPKVSGNSNILYCISCSSKLDISLKTAEILIKTNELKGKNQSFSNTYETTLKCGSVGKIDDKQYVVIGVILKENPEYTEEKWVEYLLYKKGGHGVYLWLVEDRSNPSYWKISTQLNKFPQTTNLSTSITYQNITYDIKEESIYKGKTLAVWGAFPWEVNVDDIVFITDYHAKGKNLTVISKEKIITQTHQEITYSKLENIPASKIMEYFKLSPAHFVSNSNINSENLESSKNFLSLVKKVFNSFYASTFLVFLIIFGFGSFGWFLATILISFIFWSFENHLSNESDS